MWTAIATVLLSLSWLACAEELSILPATSSDKLIDGNFKSMKMVFGGNAGKNEVKIVLLGSMQIVTIFFINLSDSSLSNKFFGTSAIWVGDNATAYSTSLSKCSADFFDTSFQKMTQPCTGRYVVLRRALLPSNGVATYHMG